MTHGPCPDLVSLPSPANVVASKYRAFPLGPLFGSVPSPCLTSKAPPFYTGAFNPLHPPALP